VYDSEIWAMKGNDMRRWEWVENTMLRWVCSVTLGDKKRTTGLTDCLGAVCVKEVVSRGMTDMGN